MLSATHLTPPSSGQVADGLRPAPMAAPCIACPCQQQALLIPRPRAAATAGRAWQRSDLNLLQLRACAGGQPPPCQRPSPAPASASGSHAWPRHGRLRRQHLWLLRTCARPASATATSGCYGLRGHLRLLPRPAPPPACNGCARARPGSSLAARCLHRAGFHQRRPRHGRLPLPTATTACMRASSSERKYQGPSKHPRVRT
jgi:hypothetical protein